MLNRILEKSGLVILARGGSGDPLITDISYDSRKVSKGSLYIAIPGTKLHGDSFIKEAISRGATAIISQNPQSELSVPWVQLENPRIAPGKLGAALWNVDLNKAGVVGITGTNGKTTTAHLFEKLLMKRYTSGRVWMFGTIDYHIDGQCYPAEHTTPEALDIFRFIGNASSVPEGLVMEVSSHSLALNRIAGLCYDCAVWTNLTQDHLDFHKDMESYYQAKKRLFTEYLKPEGCPVINIDDPHGQRLADELSNRRCITYGQAESANVRISSWHCDWGGSRVEIVTDGKTYTFESCLRGFFNVYNMSAMIAGGIGLGFTPEQISSAFAEITTVPGRMDRVWLDAPFTVIVDYAHTPDALVNILRTARPLTEGNLICVFGCGGDRDKTKRPLMGSAVAEYADEAIVTSDNPRSERPQKIIDDIVPGIPLDFPHICIADRREAIKAALSRAEKGDCIVIAGKGHEDYQEINEVRHHFNDKEVVTELFNSMRKD